MKSSLGQEITSVLRCGWAQGWQIQAALNHKRRKWMSESTCTRQIRLLREKGSPVECKIIKGRYCYRIARKR